MATKSSSSNDEPTVETTDADPPPEETPAPTDETPEQQPEETVFYELPPALKNAGLVGVVGVTSGIITLPSGLSYNMVPGSAFAIDSGDAQAAVDQGAAVMLDTYAIS